MIFSQKNSGDALFSAAKRLYDASQFDEANALLQQLLEQQPGHADAYFYLGNIADKLIDADAGYEVFCRSSQA